MSDKFEYGTGRRKTATARTRVYAGSGNITVNGRAFEDYFPRKTLQMIIRQPLVLSKLAEKLDVRVNVAGGGVAGQAEAVRHGISRALLLVDPALRPILKKAGFLTLTVNEDMTLSKTDVVSVYAIHVGEGVTLSKVENGSGTEVTPVSKNGNVWYVKDTDNAQKFTVKTADADAVILVTGSDVSNSTAKTGTKTSAQVLDNSSVISADVYLYAASKVDTSAFSSSAVKVNGKTVNNNDYVKVGETLVTTLDDSEDTGVIATTTSETAVAGKSVADGYKVGNEDVTLNAAWKITLNGIDSIKVVTTGETVTDGDYVVDSKELDYDTAKGANHILDTTSGVIYGSTAVSSDVTVDKNIELSAATKVVLTDNKIATAGYRTGTDRYQEIGAPSGSDVTAYVVPGTVIEVTGKTTTTGTVIDIQVSSGTAPEKTVDEAASTTLGAYAEFRLGDVDVTLTEK